MARTRWKRKPSRRLPQQKRFLLVVEGDVTEREYITAVRQSLRKGTANIRIEHRCTEPIGMVNHAKELQKAAKKTDKYDKVWCVFDTETKLTQQSRQGLVEALTVAHHAGIGCAISNPCFELWLLWHREDRNSWIASHEVQRLCRERGITKDDGKHLSDANNLYLTGYRGAKERASDAETRHQNNGTTKPEDKNPSSGVYVLIDAILEAFPMPK